MTLCYHNIYPWKQGELTTRKPNGRPPQCDPETVEQWIAGSDVALPLHLVGKILKRIRRDERPSSNCWVWTGSRDQRGYGHVYIGTLSSGDRHVDRFHRVMYRLLVGVIPEHLSVLHHCDNPPCGNPNHLFLGTQTDNMADCSRKRRHPWCAENRVKRAVPLLAGAPHAL